MKPCRDDRPVTCKFKQKGSSWATGEHSGVDFGTPTGDPVYAMWDGVLTGTSWGSAYGTAWVIDHDRLPDGRAGYWAVYAHLKSKVGKAGTRVKAGQLIGYSNNTGNSTGPHLHVEIQPQPTWVKGSYRNPQPWIDARKDDDMPLSDDDIERIAQAVNRTLGDWTASGDVQDAADDPPKTASTRIRQIAKDTGSRG